MSVLIKGMELPTGCKFCAMMRYYPSNGNVWCNATNRRMQYRDSVLSNRQEFCPLVEVPTPHGRLIDADELITKVQKLYCKDCILRTGKKNGKMQYIYEIGEAPCRGCWIDDMVSEIGDAPTIIEAEGSDT